MRATLLAVIALLVVASSASAFTIEHWQARDAGRRIHYGITVCGVVGTVLFHVSLHTDAGIGPTYTSDYTGHETSAACDRWVLAENDRYASGQWDARVRVAYHGSARYSSRYFFQIR